MFSVPHSRGRLTRGPAMPYRKGDVKREMGTVLPFVKSNPSTHKGCKTDRRRNPSHISSSSAFLWCGWGGGRRSLQGNLFPIGPNETPNHSSVCLLMVPERGNVQPMYSGVIHSHTQGRTCAWVSVRNLTYRTEFPQQQGIRVECQVGFGLDGM